MTRLLWSQTHGLSRPAVYCFITIERVSGYLNGEAVMLLCIN